MSASDTAVAAAAAGHNVANITCKFCGSVILQKGVAAVCPPGESHRLPAMHAKRASRPEDFPMEECGGVWWQVGDMFEFENVGFSNSVEGVRYLICADCEKGPIGFVRPAGENGLAACHLVSSARVKTDDNDNNDEASSAIAATSTAVATPAASESTE